MIGLLIGLVEYLEVYFIGHGEFKYIENIINIKIKKNEIPTNYV